MTLTPSSQAVLPLQQTADFQQRCVGALLRPTPSVPWARVRSKRDGPGHWNVQIDVTRSRTLGGNGAGVGGSCREQMKLNYDSQRGEEAKGGGNPR